MEEMAKDVDTPIDGIETHLETIKRVPRAATLYCLTALLIAPSVTFQV
jgi:hypothetical protein